MKLRPEEVIQAQIVDYIRKSMPAVMVFCSLNGAWLGGGNKAYTYIAKLKVLGLRTGEPDLRIHWEPHHTLYLECKAGRNSTTDSQRECIADLRRIGFPVEVVYSLDEAIAAMRSHGAPVRNR